MEDLWGEARFYKAENTGTRATLSCPEERKIICRSAPSFSPKFRASQEALKQAKVIQISSLAEALLPKEKGIRPDVHWNDKPDAQDKAIRDEEKLYKGWER